jgi:hypothetical protein
MIKASTIVIFVIAIITTMASAQTHIHTLKGTWQFEGGIYNGSPDGAPKDYTMQRNYTDKSFAAFASQQGYKTEKYEAGNYIIKGDTCFETQTYSSRPSQTTGKTVAYLFKVQKNVLTLSGTLPSGMVVEEHWILIIPNRKK